MKKMLALLITLMLVISAVSPNRRDGPPVPDKP